MARLLKITVPEKYTNALLKELKDKDGLLSLEIHKNVSIIPPGDILTIQVTNTSLNNYMHILEKYHLGKEEGVSLSTSDPDSIITNQPDYRIEQDKQEAIWEEVEMVISKDSNMSLNILIMMVMAGAITTAASLPVQYTW